MFCGECNSRNILQAGWTIELIWLKNVRAITRANETQKILLRTVAKVTYMFDDDLSAKFQFLFVLGVCVCFSFDRATTS